MKRHSLKEWIATTRYWSFSVSAFPVIATLAYLYATRPYDEINLLYGLLAMVGAVLFHTAGNLISDVGDYRTGADNEHAYAVPTLVKGIFQPKEYMTLAWVMLAIGVGIGLFLAWKVGIELLIIGVIGAILTLIYTNTKFAYLSDINIFIVFGILILLGTSVAASGHICYDVMWLTVPIGFITLSVLHANNTVDITTDQKAGMRTLAMLMGESTAVKTYMCYQILPFLWVILCVCISTLPWTSLLCLLALIPAIKNIRQAMKYKTQGIDAIKGLDLASAKLQLVFSLSLTIGLLLSLAF